MKPTMSASVSDDEALRQLWDALQPAIKAGQVSWSGKKVTAIKRIELLAGGTPVSELVIQARRGL